MYYPIQIPYTLNREFSRYMKYEESPAEDCGGFIICFWEMKPLSNRRLSVQNIIAADACIDLVASHDERSIGFAGMRRTNFHFQVELPTHSIGARMMPGAFHQLTGLSAVAAMDRFLPLDMVWQDFDQSHFFSLQIEQANAYFKAFLRDKTRNRTPDLFTSLFHTLSHHAFATATELYSLLHFSPRQCQRLFDKHYGIAPKMALSIVRFQKCLEILTSPTASPNHILSATTYYDQPHLINDFKRHMGLTPMELLRLYEK